MGERKIMATDTRSDTAVTTETSCSASVCMKKNQFIAFLCLQITRSSQIWLNHQDLFKLNFFPVVCHFCVNLKQSLQIQMSVRYFRGKHKLRTNKHTVSLTACIYPFILVYSVCTLYVEKSYHFICVLLLLVSVLL